jgi:hypothetical protein
MVLTKLENEWSSIEVRLDGLGLADKKEMWNGKQKKRSQFPRISE